MDIVERLNKIKKQIDEAKNLKARTEGQYTELLESLKEYQCTSLEDAEILLKSLEKEKQDLNKEILEGLKELENGYDWNI